MLVPLDWRDGKIGRLRVDIELRSGSFRSSSEVIDGAPEETSVAVVDMVGIVVGWVSGGKDVVSPAGIGGFDMVENEWRFRAGQSWSELVRAGS